MQDDENLRAFLDELRSSREMIDSGRVLDIGSTWDPLHRCLTDGELDPAGGEFPLNTVILGGKQLHRGDDYTAVLIRPDMVSFVEGALGEIEEEDFRKKFFNLPESYAGPRDEKEFMALWLQLQNLKVFFEAASENMEAVVFTAKF
jgi:hypothetical protein